MSTSILPIALRRTAGGAPATSGRRAATAPALVAVSSAVVVAVMATHTLARGRVWRHEWLWAAYQYHFGVLLVGPVLCGVAAYSGRTVAQARWLHRTAAHPFAAMAPLVVTWGAAALAYVVAFAVPATVVVAADPVDGFGLDAARTFLPALAALGAYVAVGYLAGAWRPIRVTPPLAAIGSFALTMAGWMSGAEHVVRLGGAGTTMSTFSPAALPQVVQVVAYAALGIGAGGLAVRHLAGGRRVTLVPVGMVAAVAVGWLLVGGSPLFDHHPARQACLTRDGQRYCAARPYARAMAPVVERLAPVVERLRGVGAAVPPSLSLGNATELFDGGLTPAVVATELWPLLGAQRCPMTAQPGVAMYLATWLALVAGEPASTLGLDLDPSVPPALRSSDPAAQDRWAATAVREVRARCP